MPATMTKVDVSNAQHNIKLFII